MHTRLISLALAVLVALFYLPTLHDSFTSDAFVWVRYVAEGRFLDRVAEAFTQPFFHSAAISYYRPISNFLFALEYQVSGVNPVGFHVTSIALHVANVILVGCLAARLLGSRGAALLASAAFALYPLHPGAVASTAYQATTFATFFTLVSLWTYLSHRERSRPWHCALSLVAFACALGSYETALALPPLLVAWELLANDPRRTLRTRAAHLAPYLGVLAVYFLARWSVLGSVGAGNMTPLRLLREVTLNYPQSAWRLLNPMHAAEPFDSLLRTVFWALVPLAWLTRSRLPSADRAGAKRLLFSVLWFSAFLALSPNRLVSPATGRFAYQSAAGIAFALAWLLSPGATSPSARPAVRAVALTTFGVWALWSGRLQLEYRNAFSEAAALTATIQTQLIELDAELPEGTPILFGDYPYGIERETFTLAQVYHWGLTDSLRPPFAPRRVAIFPLPPDSYDSVGALVEREGLVVARWDTDAQRIVRTPPALPGGELGELRAFYPDPDERVAVDGFAVAFPAGPYAAYRVVLLTTGNPVVLDIDGRSAHPLAALQPALDRRRDQDASPLIARLLERARPDDAILYKRPVNAFLADVVKMFGEPTLYWWIEGLDERGELAGFSGLRRATLELASDTALERPEAR